MRDLLCL